MKGPQNIINYVIVHSHKLTGPKSVRGEQGLMSQVEKLTPSVEGDLSARTKCGNPEVNLSSQSQTVDKECKEGDIRGSHFSKINTDAPSVFDEKKVKSDDKMNVVDKKSVKSLIEKIENNKKTIRRN